MFQSFVITFGKAIILFQFDHTHSVNAHCCGYAFQIQFSDGFDTVVGSGELALRAWPANTPGRMLHASGFYAIYDSLAVEEAGNVCVATCAMPGQAGITVISPEGAVVEHVPMPDRSTTNIAFDRAERRTAYVTLSRSGRLAALPWPRKGLKLDA